MDWAREEEEAEQGEWCFLISKLYQECFHVINPKKEEEKWGRGGKKKKT